MTRETELLLLSAMYENGGNTVHRILDGHPELFVYPYESQLGTRLVNDALSSVFPAKYRWPVFALEADATQDYRAIIDEECKVRARTPHVSKFRDHAFDFSDDERLARYLDLVRGRPRSGGGNIGAFFQATFEAWRDFRRTGKEHVYVGYSPIVIVDAMRTMAEMPQARMLHVVRNPWSAYADTKKRPVPMALDAYMLAWMLNQHHAMLARQRYPDRVFVVRLEDVLPQPVAALTPLLQALGVAAEALPGRPSWNRQPLEQVYPWGTIRTATLAANRATAAELSADEQAAVRLAAGPYLELLGYGAYLDT